MIAQRFLQIKTMGWAASLVFLMASSSLLSQEAEELQENYIPTVADELDELERRFYAIRQTEEDAGDVNGALRMPCAFTSTRSLSMCSSSSAELLSEY